MPHFIKAPASTDEFRTSAERYAYDKGRLQASLNEACGVLEAQAERELARDNFKTGYSLQTAAARYRATLADVEAR